MKLKAIAGQSKPRPAMRDYRPVTRARTMHPATAMTPPMTERSEGRSPSSQNAIGIERRGVVATMGRTTPLGVVASAHWKQPTPATGPAKPLPSVHSQDARALPGAEGAGPGSRRRSRRIQNQRNVKASPAGSLSYAAVSPKVTFETDSPAAEATMTALRLRSAAPRP